MALPVVKTALPFMFNLSQLCTNAQNEKKKDNKKEMKKHYQGLKRTEENKRQLIPSAIQAPFCQI